MSNYKKSDKNTKNKRKSIFTILETLMNSGFWRGHFLKICSKIAILPTLLIFVIILQILHNQYLKYELNSMQGEITQITEQFKSIVDDYEEKLAANKITIEYLSEENKHNNELNKKLNEEVTELNKVIKIIADNFSLSRMELIDDPKTISRGGGGVPLSKELQMYIVNEAKTYNISYELILGLIYTESTFNPKAISYNNSSVGLMQINRYNTLDWLAGEVGISNVDPFNPYHSVKMGVWYLNFLKQYWLDKGLSNENAEKAMLISYHRGLGGAKSYIKNYGYNSKYTKKIYEFKSQLKVGE